MAGKQEAVKAKQEEADVDGDCVGDAIHFVSGNPFVEVTKGVLHLYKEDDRAAESPSQPTRTSCTVCFLAVPASMSCHDLMTFMAAFHDDIKHVRIIRDGSPNQYMSLVTFRCEESAKAFYSAFQGAPFNSLEPDRRCHLVFVSRVETLGEEQRTTPPPAHNELPTCPVCLERMDESLDVILAILCNHAFHGGCLAKWEDASCPVCRYVQTPEAVADNRCMECHSTESLWICLLCGHVGCGRYIGGHAYQHYIESQHCYCMELGNNRVWDYVGDNFVHRLLQNKGDGKLVEGPAPAGKDEEKLDSMQMEFTYLLSCQLEAQRKNYEEKIGRLENRSVDELDELKRLASRREKENAVLTSTVARLTKEKQAADKRLQQQITKTARLQADLDEEKEMNKALQQNQAAFQEKLKEQEGKLKEQENELRDLREQLRDVMFALEAGRLIASSDDRDEIAEGRIVVGERPHGSARGRHRNRHK